MCPYSSIARAAAQGGQVEFRAIVEINSYECAILILCTKHDNKIYKFHVNRTEV